MNDKTIKTNIQRAREKVSLSQEEMADKLGISRQAYMRIESGKTTLIHKHLQDIADQCGVSLGKLLLGYEPGKDAAKVESELRESSAKLLYTEHERDVYKAKSEEDAKLIESLNAHIKTLQMIVNSRTHEEE